LTNQLDIIRQNSSDKSIIFQMIDIKPYWRLYTHLDNTRGQQIEYISIVK